jgi:tetratricopeptide (TPR) repeat protein
MAIECLQTLADEHPESPFAAAGLKRLADALYQRGRQAESEEATQRLLQTYPSSDAALDGGRLLITRLQEAGRLQEAVAVAERVSRIAPAEEKPISLMNLGDLLADHHVAQYTDAMAAFEEAEALATRLGRELAAQDTKDGAAVNRMREFSGISQSARERLDALRREHGS